MYEHDNEPIYDHEHGRWLCANHAIAELCALKHEGDYIYTYDRDDNGKMINIELAHDPHSDKRKPPKIRGGRIQGNRG